MIHTLIGWTADITTWKAGVLLLLTGCGCLAWGYATATGSTGTTGGLARSWARLIVGIVLAIAGLALLTLDPGGGS